MAGDTIAMTLLGVGAGVVATMTMDVLGIVARRIGLTKGVSGKWVGHLCFSLVSYVPGTGVRAARPKGAS